MRPKLLVFINRSPWNELVLRGQRTIKYGGNKINHVGLVLLYTSKSKPDPEGVELLTDPDEADALPRGVVVGTCLFKCVTGDGYYEYHLSEPHRFPEPVVVSKRGPVRFYTTEATPDIERQLRRAGLWREALLKAAK